MRSEDSRAKIVLVVEYDGSGYCGFQRQKNQPTIQQEIENALTRLTGETITVKGASRTDAGVHAKGQVVSISTRSYLKPRVFVSGLNYYLPDDIAVITGYMVDSDFDVRHGAISREYRYSILNRQARSPLDSRCSYHVTKPLDNEKMGMAGKQLTGVHDFASFITCVTEKMSTVRRMDSVETSRNGDKINIDIKANAFLPHQVRNTVGSLIKVGLGDLTVEEFSSMLDRRQPGLAGPTVPACGLCLMRVNYG